MEKNLIMSFIFKKPPFGGHDVGSNLALGL